MKHRLIALLGATVIAISSPALHAEEAGDLTILDAYSRATPPRAPVGGAWLTMTNHGTTDDRLLSVTSPASETVQLHAMAEKDGMMTMRSLPDGLEVPAGETVTLAPAGTHLMLMGLTGPLVEGDTLDMVLHFEKAGDVPIRVPVIAIGARNPAGDHGSMDHGSMDHSAMDHSAMDHSAMDHSAMDHSAMDHSAMDHSAMDHGTMDHTMGHGMDHATGDHTGHDHASHHAAAFDQTTVEGDDARITGLLKATFETEDAPLTVAPVLVDGDVAVVGWSQDDQGGRALLRRNEAGLWRVDLCAGDGLKGQANMETLGIDPETAARLAAAQTEAEAALPAEQVASFSLFDGVVHVEAE